MNCLFRKILIRYVLAAFILIFLCAAPFIKSAGAYSLTINHSGTGSGSIYGDVSCVLASGGQCLEPSLSTTVTFDAIGDWKSVFVGWGAPCADTGSCTISADAVMTATFDLYKRVGIGSMFVVPAYATITDAYAVADDGNEIWAPSYTFSEDVVLNRNIFIKLTGGTEGGIPVSGSSTTLQGTLDASVGSALIYKFIVRDLVVSGGSVTIDSLTIQ